MNYAKQKMRDSGLKLLTCAMIVSSLAACGGGEGENTSLPTVGQQLSDSEKDRYYVPLEFYNYVFFDKSQFSGLKYQYPENFDGELRAEDRTNIIADSFPGDIHYARFIVSGIATNATAELKVTGAEFALDPATGIFDETTYEDDLSKLSFQSGGATVSNGDWVWLKFDAPSQFSQAGNIASHSVSIELGNQVNPLTGETLVEKDTDTGLAVLYDPTTGEITEDETIGVTKPIGTKVAFISAINPMENAKPLSFEFKDSVGQSAVSADTYVVTNSVNVTSITEQLIEETNDRSLLTYNFEGLTAASAPISIIGAGEYCIVPRGSVECGAWQTAESTIKPLEQVKVKVKASATKLAEVSARLVIGEGDHSACLTQAEIDADSAIQADYQQRLGEWESTEATREELEGDAFIPSEPPLVYDNEQMVCDILTVATLGDIELNKALMFPPQNSFTTANKILAYGYVDLRESAESSTQFNKLELSGSAGTSNLLDTNCNQEQTRCLWEAELYLVDGINDFNVSFDTNVGEPVEVAFSVTKGLDDEGFPSSVTYPAMHEMNSVRDITIDRANNRLLALESQFRAAKIVGIDLETGNRVILKDLSKEPENYANTYGIQVDPANERVLVSVRSGGHFIQAFDLATFTGIEFSKKGGTGEGTTPFNIPGQMDIDEVNDRLLVTTNNPNSPNGLFSVDLVTGDRRVISQDSAPFGAAFDKDNNRYLAMVGDSAQPIGTIDIVTPIQTKQDYNFLGSHSFSDADSIAVASWSNLETFESIQAKYEGNYTPEGGNGFALVIDRPNLTIHKIALEDGSASVFSSYDLNSPELSVPSSENGFAFVAGGNDGNGYGLEAIVIEGGLGYAVAVDNERDAIYGIDLRTGTRVYISKSAK